MAYLDCFEHKNHVTSTKQSHSQRFLPTCTTLFIISLHILSTVVNRLPSSGIWDIMSGELKMGSKYSHVAWTLSHSSRTSWSSRSLPSHCLRSKTQWLLSTANQAMFPMIKLKTMTRLSILYAMVLFQFPFFYLLALFYKICL